MKGFTEDMDRAFLDHHYDSILISNREKISAGGTVDPFLANACSDNRMSLVVLIRLPSEIQEKILACMNDLKAIEPDLYFYPAESFHITVMDVLKGEEGRKIPPNIDDYIRCIKDCSRTISPFSIEFRGLTASDNAVLVRGYYDDHLMIFRQNLRKMLQQRGLLLQERYETISSHITIARLYDRFRNAEMLLDYVEKPVSFGTMKVTELEVSFHNWYDTRRETLSILSVSHGDRSTDSGNV